MHARAILVGIVLASCKLKGLGALAEDAGATPVASVSASATAEPIASAAVDAGAAPIVHTKAAAPTTATAPKKTGIPTCAAGQVLASEALSPLSPFCAAKCKADSDCKTTSCTSANRLEADGTVPKGGQEFIKVCNPEYAKTTPSATSSAKAAAPPKCKASEHYDDIDKKCRPLGDCPKGYSWNDPMQSCIMQ